MTSSSGRTRTRLSPEQRKFQLLNNAMEVFATRGIGRAGHADIAELAHVSVATVFNYFPSREKLVNAVLAESANCFHQLIQECLNDPKDTAKDALVDILCAIVNNALEDKDWLKVWFEWSTSIREDIWPSYVLARDDIDKKIVELVALGISCENVKTQHEPQTIAKLFDGISYILYLQANRQPDNEELVRQANAYIDMLFD